MRPAKFPYLEHEGFLAFAHRGGAHGPSPENTMPAFEHAVSQGYRYVETDVHATSDGVLLAFHDDQLDRVTDKTGAIADLSYDEVRQARVGGSEHIPLLQDMLCAWPDLKINIDAKQDNAVGPLVRVIQDSGAIERVSIGTFSDRRTRAIRDALGERLCTGLGPTGVSRLRFGSLAGPAAVFFGGFVEGAAQIPVTQSGIRLVDRRLINFAHEKDLQVHVWTIDEAAEMERLIDLGVDGIMTDRVDVLKSVLVRRGLWE